MRIVLSLLASACLLAPARGDDGPFLVKPYIQLGDAPSAGTLQLLWHADDADADWSVDYRPAADAPWTKAGAAVLHRVTVVGVPPHRVYRATLSGLRPGGRFAYKVAVRGKEVFAGEAPSPKSADQPYRFLVFGDVGANTPDERAVAYRASLQKADFVFISGDIVYDRGRVTEYRRNFWPMLNADEASPSVGAPLMRSTLFLAAPGNHDTAARDLGRFTDGLAYYFTWNQPRNGPLGPAVAAYAPAPTGPEANTRAFLASAGDDYPRLANFSFDYANAHWTVLDANAYVDWSDPDLRAWVERDLASAKDATWRFVAFHQPGFNSSRVHFAEQQMRVLAPLFEAGKVDVVFNGHVHNYQRSFPLRFVPGKSVGRRERGKPVDGTWTLDRAFDGKANTRPEGVIYIVTGAGGQHLYNPEQQDDPASWQGFTDKFISKVFSLTVADMDGPTLTIRQVGVDGKELDSFVITKPGSAAGAGGR